MTARVTDCGSGWRERVSVLRQRCDGERDRYLLRAGSQRLQPRLQPPAWLHRACHLYHRLRNQLDQHRSAESPRDDQHHQLHPLGTGSCRPACHARVYSLCPTHEHQNRPAGQQEHLRVGRLRLLPLHIQSNFSHDLDLASGDVGRLALHRHCIPAEKQNLV